MPEINIKDYFTSSKAFFIAVSKYSAASIPGLSSAEADVALLKKKLEEEHGFECPSVIHDQQQQYANPLINPDGNTLLQYLSSIQVKENDRVVIYFAGHGIAVDSDGVPSGYLLPANADPSDPASFVAIQEVLEAVQKHKCKHLLLILDACFGGTFQWGDLSLEGLQERSGTIYFEKLRQYANHKAWHVLSSAAWQQSTSGILRLGKRERKPGDINSPFAKFLAAAISSEADMADGSASPDGIITIAELGSFLQNTNASNKITVKGGNAVNNGPRLYHLYAQDQKSNSRGEFFFINPFAVRERGRIILPNFDRSNPFKGLEAYNIQDSGNFYGRQRAIFGGDNETGLKKAFEDNDLVIVTGPAGIGKTSLVRAGLFPLLSDATLVKQMQPGRAPFSINSQLINELTQSTTKHILLVDQYEEIFTLAEDHIERTAFESALAQLANRHKVILTIRDDFEQRLGNTFFINAVGRLSIATFKVPAFTRAELEEIIRKPAEQHMLSYQAITNTARDNEVFVERIVNESFSLPLSIPSLSLMLSELFSQQENRGLPETIYNQLNGVAGILSLKANNAWNKYKDDEQQRELFRWLIFRMISIQGGSIVKRRIYTNLNSTGGADKTYDELNYWYDQTTVYLKQIAGYLVEEKLVVAGIDEAGKAYIEPAHEILLLRWELIQEWLGTKGNVLASEQSRIMLHQLVNDSALRYYLQRRRRDKQQYLWKYSPLLAETKKNLLPRLNIYEEVFIKRSWNAGMRSQRWMKAGIVTMIIGIIGVAAFFYLRAGMAMRAAKKTQSLSLLAIADASELTDGLNLLKIAYTRDSTSPEVQSKIIAFSEYDREVNRFLRGVGTLSQVPAQLECMNDSLYVFNAPGTVIFHNTEGDKPATIADSKLYPRMLLAPDKKSIAAYIHGYALKLLNTNGAITDSLATGIQDPNDRLQFQFIWNRLLVLLPRFVVARQEGVNDTIKPRPGSIFTGFCPSPVRDIIWLGCSDGSIFQYNLLLRKLNFIKAGDRSVKSLTLLPQGRICLLDTDSLITIYNSEFEKFNFLKAKKVNSIYAFRNSSRLLLHTASPSDSLMIWNYENGSKTLLQQMNDGDGFDIAPSEKFLLVNNKNNVNVLDNRGAKVFSYALDDAAGLSGVRFTGNDKGFIAYSFPNKKTYHWKLDSSSLFAMYLPDAYNITANAMIKPFAPLSRREVLTTAELVKMLSANQPTASFTTGAAASGKLHYAYNSGSQVFIQNTISMDTFQCRFSPGENILLADFTKKEDSLVIITNKGRAGLIAVNRPTALREITNLDKTIKVASFNATVNTFCLQDSASGKLGLYKLNKLPYFTTAIPSAVWSTDTSCTKITYLAGDTIHMLDIDSKEELTFKLNERNISHAIISPGADHIAFTTVTAAGTIIKLYTFEAGKPAQLLHTYQLSVKESDIAWLKFSLDGSYIFLCQRNSFIKNYLTPLGAGKWIKQIKAAPLSDIAKQKYSL